MFKSFTPFYNLPPKHFTKLQRGIKKGKEISEMEITTWQKGFIWTIHDFFSQKSWRRENFFVSHIKNNCRNGTKVRIILSRLLQISIANKCWNGCLTALVSLFSRVYIEIFSVYKRLHQLIIAMRPIRLCRTKLYHHNDPQGKSGPSICFNFLSHLPMNEFSLLNKAKKKKKNLWNNLNQANNPFVSAKTFLFA